jgi:hypothetical protein
MCFANASMQLLFASPYFVSFAHFMKSNQPLFSPSQQERTPTWAHFCRFLRDFEFADCGSAGGELPSLKSLEFLKKPAPTSLAELDGVLGPFASNRRPKTQEDAIQFLMFFLNRLHDEILALAPPPPDDGVEWKVQGAGRGHMPLQQLRDPESPLLAIFSTLVRANTLQNGKSRTVADDRFLVLPLQIQGIKDLQEAIQAFTAEQKVEEGLSQKYIFLQCPRSLIIGLKRFEYDPGRGRQSKLTQLIEYPEMLTVEGTTKGYNYRLCAVVEHVGASPEGGHYLCYARRFDGKWVRFDDSDVTELTGGAYLRAQAYLLLYNQTAG